MHYKGFLCAIAALLIALYTAPATRGAEPGWIGVEVYSLSAAEATQLGWSARRGAKVFLPVRGGPAAIAGIRSDDIILSINDIGIEDSIALTKIAASIAPGTSANFKIYRGDQEQIIVVVLGARASTIPSASTADIQELAAAGNVRAMSMLGTRYRKGDGVPTDHQLALVWYEKAAAAGDEWALNEMGWLYYSGSGTRQDYDQARRFFEKAATAGNVESMYGLGTLFIDGKGVRQDYEQARRWLEKASAGGNPSAMTNLGFLYEKGRGVRQDFIEARHWYEKAAAANDPWAMNNLGVFYHNGTGVRRDYEQARAWYQKAAAAGNEKAKENLGKLDNPNRSRRNAGGRTNRSSAGNDDGWVAPNHQPKFYPPGMTPPGGSYRNPGGGHTCIGPQCF